MCHQQGESSIVAKFSHQQELMDSWLESDGGLSKKVLMECMH